MNHVVLTACLAAMRLRGAGPARGAAAPLRLSLISGTGPRDRREHGKERPLMMTRIPWRRPGAARPARLPARPRALAAALAALLACGGLAAAAAAPAASAASSASSSGSTLRIEDDTSISTFNPFLSYFDGELNILGSIYPTLTMINEQGKPE